MIITEELFQEVLNRDNSSYKPSCGDICLHIDVNSTPIAKVVVVDFTGSNTLMSGVLVLSGWLANSIIGVSTVVIENKDLYLLTNSELDRICTTGRELEIVKGVSTRAKTIDETISEAKIWISSLTQNVEVQTTINTSKYVDLMFYKDVEAAKKSVDLSSNEIWKLIIDKSEEKFGTNNVYYGKYNDNLVVALVYDSIIIKNSSRNSHCITGLVVSFQVTPQGKMSRGLKGNRIKLSVSEFDGLYAHSHLAGFRHYTNKQAATYANNQAFCLGTGDFAAFISERTLTAFNEMSYELFLSMLDNYVSWESKEGTPYVYMSEITRRERVNTAGHNSNSTLDMVINTVYTHFNSLVTSSDLNIIPTDLDNLKFEVDINYGPYIKAVESAIKLAYPNDHSRYMFIQNGDFDYRPNNSPNSADNLNRTARYACIIPGVAKKVEFYNAYSTESNELRPSIYIRKEIANRISESIKNKLKTELQCQ